MTDEEKKKFFEISKRIGYKVGTYCNDEEVEVFEKLLKDYKYKNNLIEKQQAELKKKDKIIDEMANHIATSDNNLCQYLDMTTKCKYYAGENKNTCDNCIKDYFKKKVEVKDE